MLSREKNEENREIEPIMISVVNIISAQTKWNCFRDWGAFSITLIEGKEFRYKYYFHSKKTKKSTIGFIPIFDFIQFQNQV